jgi:A/G-specific adenine glycosylase
MHLSSGPKEVRIRSSFQELLFLYDAGMDDKIFRKTVLSHWRRHGRHELPWRQTENPYHILVSEIMLQQTQVDRVIPKYREFLAAFPTFRRLALASAADLLKVWQGLGYNRRALMLQRCAQAVMRDCRGRLPDTHEALCDLPGIGPYTAGAVLACGLNNPQPNFYKKNTPGYINN